MLGTTGDWAASSQRPAPGTQFGLPIILLGESHKGKIVKMCEYFDFLTPTEHERTLVDARGAPSTAYFPAESSNHMDAAGM